MGVGVWGVKERNTNSLQGKSVDGGLTPESCPATEMLADLIQPVYLLKQMNWFSAAESFVEDF